MNKLLKYLLIGLAVVSIGVACTNAEFNCNNVFLTANDRQVGSETMSIAWSEFTNSDLFCFDNRIANNKVAYKLNNNDNRTYLGMYESICVYKNEGFNTIYVKYDQAGKGAWAYLDSSCIDKVYTSLQCQTEYNLIPISEVTPNYCALNFGMIDPQECPINSGTGAIVRSNLMINDIPYAQNQNINVFIPDFLAWNISFNDLYTVIEVEGYNADTDYIENVINNEKLTPTNEEFANLLQTLVNFIPYLFIGLLIIYFVKILNKVWK